MESESAFQGYFDYDKEKFPLGFGKVLPQEERDRVIIPELMNRISEPGRAPPGRSYLDCGMTCDEAAQYMMSREAESKLDLIAFRARVIESVQVHFGKDLSCSEALLAGLTPGVIGKPDEIFKMLKQVMIKESLNTKGYTEKLRKVFLDTTQNV